MNRAPLLAATAVLFFSFFQAAIFAAAIPAAAIPDSSQIIAVEHVSVIPMDAERVVADQTVILRGERIEIVGPAASIVTPAGARKIDGRGLYLIPGLADMHVHNWRPQEHALLLAYGVTRERNLTGSPIQLMFRANSAKGETLAPRITTSGPIIDGDPPVWPGSNVAKQPSDAAGVVAAQKAAGYDFLKVYSRLGPESFFAVAAAADQAGMIFGGHIPPQVSVSDAIGAGMHFVEHLTGYLGAVQRPGSKITAMTLAEASKLPNIERSRLLLAGFDEDQVAKIVKTTCDAGVWNTPTLIVLERVYGLPDEKRAWNDWPQMRTVDPGTKNFWNPSNDFRFANMTDEELLMGQQLQRLLPRIVKALSDAGCNLMIGTDLANPYVFAGYSVHEELQRFVAAGISPFKALRAATTEPARFLGVENEQGQIGPGFAADLVLLRANPLERIENTLQIESVFSRGRYLDRAALSELIEGVAQQYQ